ncbi:MAG: hypothetical protein ACYDC3_10240 [Candidatus Binataceae bacterium]
MTPEILDRIRTIVTMLVKGYGREWNEIFAPDRAALNQNIEDLLKLIEATPDEHVDAILRELNGTRLLSQEVAQKLIDRYGAPPLPKVGFRNSKSEKPKD